jgi:hypothetical protein
VEKLIGSSGKRKISELAKQCLRYLGACQKTLSLANEDLEPARQCLRSPTPLETGAEALASGHELHCSLTVAAVNVCKKGRYATQADATRTVKAAGGVAEGTHHCNLRKRHLEKEKLTKVNAETQV